VGHAAVLQPIGRASSTLVDDVVEALTQRIVTGELEPGAKLRQEECAALLGVSRTPLREAFQRLEADGWVHLRARQGAVVTALSADEAEQIFTLRVLHEAFAARLSAVTHPAADEEAAEACIALARTEDGSMDTAEAANQRFHELVYGLDHASAPPELVASVRRHWSRALRYRRLYWRVSGARGSSAASHREILAAWRARDVEATERAVAGHILGALSEITGRIDPERPPSVAVTELARRYGLTLPVRPETR